MTKQEYTEIINNLDIVQIEAYIKKLWGKKKVLKWFWEILTLYTIDNNSYWWRAFLLYCFDKYNDKAIYYIPDNNG